MQCIIRNKNVIQPCCGGIQAMEMNKPMKVDVRLMDGRVLTLPIDSSSISSELCSAIAQKINLKDTFGFSLYISYCDKVRAEYGFSCSGPLLLFVICEQLNVFSFKKSLVSIHIHSAVVADKTKMAPSCSSDPGVCSCLCRSGL